jgi:hypothetical protein
LGNNAAGLRRHWRNPEENPSCESSLGTSLSLANALDLRSFKRRAACPEREQKRNASCSGEQQAQMQDARRNKGPFAAD